MNNLLIAIVICISIIIVISIFCYTSYKNDENSRSNRFFRTVNFTSKQYEHMLDEISNLKSLINSIQTGIEFISMQISVKDNKDNKDE